MQPKEVDLGGTLSTSFPVGHFRSHNVPSLSIVMVVLGRNVAYASW